ncbi:MAG TPA: M56 family metallopeptidase [Candidatus Angelobacter sp.]|nr:M56 family metallopeptidase [Candidatus Angelobacter sp.]
MNFASGFHWLATAVSENLFYSAVAGTLLALAVWFLLRLFPRRNSRTSFAVWFSTLVATALLPLMRLLSNGGANGAGEHALVTVSSAWAWYVFLAWAGFAGIGLARVALATVQLRKMRAEAVAVDLKTLDADLRALIEDFQRCRKVSVLVSQRLEVPTAIGFYKPAIILPAWLPESTPAGELKYILLHELAHLRRRDDWTNLAQKILKAVLFFLPSVWWIERKLSLEREMACDDAVLAHSGSPRGYAECLARVAERSFLRRQIALAQAVVGRVRQLTTRVATILDPDRPRAAHLWKPAIPVVMALAGLCALPASFAPELVSFSDRNGSQVFSAQAQPSGGSHVPQSQTEQSSGESHGVRAVQASLKSDGVNAAPVKARSVLTRGKGERRSERTALAARKTQPAVLIANYRAPKQEDFVTVREEVFVVVTQRTASGQQSWQMHVIQISVQQSKPPEKPRKI